MLDATPLVLAATVCRRERRLLENTFKDAGFEVRGVEDAGEAAVEVAGHAGPCVLVIDSGLLEAPHDDQWRRLRAGHPQLGHVVRCLVTGSPGLRAGDGRTFLVHPDHVDGLLRAARSLTA